MYFKDTDWAPGPGTHVTLPAFPGALAKGPCGRGHYPSFYTSMPIKKNGRVTTASCLLRTLLKYPPSASVPNRS